MNSFPVVQGGLYLVRDASLSLPPNANRDVHPQRPVVVLSGPDTNSNKGWLPILVAPCSTASRRKTTYCVHLPKGSPKSLTADTWVRTALIQPLEKSDLGDFWGVIPGIKLEEIQTRLFHYLGGSTDV